MTRWHHVPEHLPIDDLPLDIPLDWSPAQALAAYEWLEQLRTRIWLLYGDDIVAFLRADRLIPTPPAGDDDPPF
jgi:hypothetical protein